MLTLVGCGGGGCYRVYVTNEASGDLSVIDGGSHTVVRTVPLGIAWPPRR